MALLLNDCKIKAFARGSVSKIDQHPRFVVCSLWKWLSLCISASRRAAFVSSMLAISDYFPLLSFCESTMCGSCVQVFVQDSIACCNLVQRLIPSLCPKAAKFCHMISNQRLLQTLTPLVIYYSDRQAELIYVLIIPISHLTLLSFPLISMTLMYFPSLNWHFSRQNAIHCCSRLASFQLIPSCWYVLTSSTSACDLEVLLLNCYSPRRRSQGAACPCAEDFCVPRGRATAERSGLTEEDVHHIPLWTASAIVRCSVSSSRCPYLRQLDREISVISK